MKTSISTDLAPKADKILSQAIVANGIVYVSGQVHVRADGTLVDGTVAERLSQIMKNISVILESANSSLDRILKVVIYVTDMSIMPELNEAYPSYFKETLPVREAVCVSALPLGASIELSIIAESN